MSPGTWGKDEGLERRAQAEEEMTMWGSGISWQRQKSIEVRILQGDCTMPISHSPAADPELVSTSLYPGQHYYGPPGQSLYMDQLFSAFSSSQVQWS